MNFFVNLGYAGMFVSAFLAATILPFSSEIVITALYSNGLPGWGLLFVASSGNILGALVNYALGFKFGRVVATKILRISEKAFLRASRFFTRWGKWSLLLCWVPIIGDPITLVAGVLRSNFWFFFCVVAMAKTARYSLLLYILS
ncbi:YqaA family protein [Alteromonas sp. A081]|uniref:YqaA family protein n=1 Tax=Alteromonas sp. A081 TaxID=3410269 RepID=UPI003B9836AB